MPNAEGRIQKFTDLDAWKQAHDLRLLVLRQLSSLPVDYRFGLSQQMQRSAVSIGSNIAEGFGRSSAKEKLQFFRIAYGSLIELQDQLIVCRDLELIMPEVIIEIEGQAQRVVQVLNGLIRSTRNLDIRHSSERKTTT